MCLSINDKRREDFSSLKFVQMQQFRDWQNMQKKKKKEVNKD